MVCTKCQNLNKTRLATPGVKRKGDLYHGSPEYASCDKKSATLGQTGVSKSKLLSKSAKNPYAQYSNSCNKCRTKVSKGHTYCNNCAFKADCCAICGKPNTKTKAGVPVVSTQKFTLK